MKEGRDKFDSWLRGLRAVYYSLCGKDRLVILGNNPFIHATFQPSPLSPQISRVNQWFKIVGLTQNADCWNPMSFISCVEKMADINHVNDLLRLNLDMNQCK